MARGISSGITVEGLADFRRDLRAINQGWSRELAKTHRDLARWETARTQARARRMGGAAAHFASALSGLGNQSGARVRVSRSQANAAFWGAKQHSGWYGHPRYDQSPAQHQRWVGNSWDVGARGQGPYAINAQIADDVNEIIDRYGQMLDDLAKKAFPN